MAKTISAILLTIILAAATCAESIDLRPRWTQGQSARYRLTQSELQTAELVGIGEPENVKTDIVVEITWRIARADESGGAASMTVDRMAFNITDPTGDQHEITINTGDEQFASMQQYIAALTGKPVEVKVNADGSIASVSGFEAIAQAAGPAGAQLDEDFFIELARDLAVINGGPASAEPGVKWDFNTKSGHSMGTVHQEMTDELIGVEVIAGIPVAVVNQNATLDFEPDLGERPVDGPEISVTTTEGAYSGQVLFDLSRNEVVGSHGRQTLGIEIAISSMGRTITRTMREVTTYQILRIAEE